MVNQNAEQLARDAIDTKLKQAGWVIEAKKDKTILTAHEAQSSRYVKSKLKWRKDIKPLPFLFEATSKVIHFTDGRDPAPRAREVFHFYKPAPQQTGTTKNVCGSCPSYL